MAGRVYADIPKFKTIERALRMVAVDQQKIVSQITNAKASAEERACLDAALAECQVALEHQKQALHEFYRVFD